MPMLTLATFVAQSCAGLRNSVTLGQLLPAPCTQYRMYLQAEGMGMGLSPVPVHDIGRRNKDTQAHEL